MLAEISVERSTGASLQSQTQILDSIDEKALVLEARNGSSDAIEQLVNLYERRLFRLARNITGNHEDAEEVVQNAFVKAFRNLDAFRGDSRFYTWIVRIAVNEGLMKIRGRRAKEISIDEPKDTEDHAAPLELEDWGPNPEQRFSQQELRGILEKTINQLHRGYRIVFQLRDVEGFSTEETAQALGLTVSAVKARLRRARMMLRDSLDVYFRSSKKRLSRFTQSQARHPRTFLYGHYSSRTYVGMSLAQSRQI